MSGRVRVAVIDSGVHAAHPHVQCVAGGVAIDQDGRQGEDFVDRLGHGTAVTAVIREKAPDAELYAVRVFDRVLSTTLAGLVGAIDWAVRSGMHLVNLSLGTRRTDGVDPLIEAVARATRQGVIVVAAQQDEDGVLCLPGSLPHVVGVHVDRACPRDRFRIEEEPDGRVVFHASAYPRPIPGVPPARNLSGVSFAVANMTGFIARAWPAVAAPVPTDTPTDEWLSPRERVARVLRVSSPSRRSG